jgi:hypothetical protein
MSNYRLVVLFLENAFFDGYLYIVITLYGQTVMITQEDTVSEANLKHYVSVLVINTNCSLALI